MPVPCGARMRSACKETPLPTSQQSPNPCPPSPSSEPPFQQQISQRALRPECFLSCQHFKIDFRVRGQVNLSCRLLLIKQFPGARRGWRGGAVEKGLLGRSSSCQGHWFMLLMGPSSGQREVWPPSQLPKPIRIVTPTPEAPHQGELGPPLLSRPAVSQLVRRSPSSLTLNPPALPTQSSGLENWR